MNWNQAASSILLVALTGTFTGCGSGPKIYHLSGNITFGGKPVPTGTIVFEPDPTAGNSGPPGYAKIKDGRYDTRAPDCQGTVGGPHLIRIAGRDGIPRGELLNGLPLFPEQTLTVDLPKQDGTKDFEVKPSQGS